MATNSGILKWKNAFIISARVKILVSTFMITLQSMVENRRMLLQINMYNIRRYLRLECPGDCEVAKCNGNLKKRRVMMISMTSSSMTLRSASQPHRTAWMYRLSHYQHLVKAILCHSATIWFWKFLHISSMKSPDIVKAETLNNLGTFQNPDEESSKVKMASSNFP